jgi:hypothetical protein
MRGEGEADQPPLALGGHRDRRAAAPASPRTITLSAGKSASVSIAARTQRGLPAGRLIGYIRGYGPVS